jgi:hypothetical protein
MNKIKCLVAILAILGLVFLTATANLEACCGVVIDMWKLDIEGGECEGPVDFSGRVYMYYWSGLSTWVLNMTIVITDENGVTVATLASPGDITTTRLRQESSYGVDDDGLIRGSTQGLTDEDGSYPVAGVDDDGDGWIDEDNGWWSGDEYADWSFSASWVPPGDETYTATITAQAGPMNTTQVAEIITAGCCADLQAYEYAWCSPGSFRFEDSGNTFIAENRVRFRNVGTEDAYNVTATISEVPTNVTVIDDTVSLGDIPVGGDAWSSDCFELSIDMTNPQDPQSMMYWDVRYIDSDQRQCIIRRVPKFPGE